MTAIEESVARIGSATAHEAAGTVGALPSVIKPIAAAMYVAGPAFPVRSPAGDNLWLHRAVYAAKPGEVLVVDVGEGFEYGYWGEVLARAAVARGLAGLVIHGGVRDSAALAERGWPVFAERVCLRGTVKDPAGDGDLGEPIRIGGVDIELGDLIIGDAAGVLRIPRDRADEVRARSMERDRAESAVFGRLEQGASTLDIYGLR
ncbi:RraA family protein [Nocardia sienata]|uniref:RraA family protein n=1 Tax=Nocardia sienata TaxID=248552 RepID=UPI0007A4BFB1|nr:RraA family protein [Nocardia sienata]